MDQGKIFEKLLKISNSENLRVAFLPSAVSYGRIKGNRIGLCTDMDIEQINYTLAHELSHHFLHYDKGNMIQSADREVYEEQADRAAKMLLTVLAM